MTHLILTGLEAQDSHTEGQEEEEEEAVEEEVRQEQQILERI